jgi:hypothetical protein
LPRCACAAHAQDLALELSALHATMASDDEEEEEEEEEVEDEELVPTPKSKAALEEPALQEQLLAEAEAEDDE